MIGDSGGRRPQFLRGVTDFAAQVYGDTMDVFLSPANFASTARARETPGERFWTYNGRPPAAGSMILDTDGVALRTWGWIAERYDVELWYAWQRALPFSDRYNHGGPDGRVVHDPDHVRTNARAVARIWGNGDAVARVSRRAPVTQTQGAQARARRQAALARAFRVWWRSNRATHRAPHRTACARRCALGAELVHRRTGLGSMRARKC